MLKKTKIPRLIIFGFAFLFFLHQPIFSQITAGLSLYLDYNLYQRYQLPIQANIEVSSSGQALNLFPIGGIGFWVGNPSGVTIGIEGGLDYTPFSFDTKNYSGLGAVSFPLLARATIPFQPQKGISPFVGIGSGIQWSRNDLYARPKGSFVADNPYFRTTVGEISLGMGAGWRKDEKKTGLIAFFTRIGSSSEKAWTVNIGLRAKLLINPKGNKIGPPISIPKERLYQAELSNTTLL